MKWLHDMEVKEATHILQATCRALRLAKMTHDDVQFTYKGVPVLLNEQTRPKDVTPKFQQALLAGDFSVIDARVGAQKGSFRPLKAAVCLAFAAITASI